MIIRCLVLTVVLATAAGSAIAQPVPQLSSQGVWETGQWQWNGYRYIWSGDQYIADRPQYRAFIPGQLVPRGRGWVWVGGHWS